MNELKAINKSRLLLIIAVMFVFSACSSRKYTARPVALPTAAAKAADAMSHLKSKELYRFISDWTGVQYVLGGLDKKGVDCSGFALLLQKYIYGNELPRRSRDQADAVKEKDLSSLNEGDLIFFSFGGGTVDHVGVYLNNNFFVHASTARGVVVDDLSIPAYQKAIVKAGTLKK
ncbi:MAG: NlpC/P60 family protein [Candidatus Pedobacter colombiensis]|uniref:NlpC/P60 family protein n=1 Tax=Candidatus Pedobacter colombiensis TaxID=3121371 RepID=A0AAJ6B889_9SPHI|nr:NlpC/P60 family protein [Pedobacter sp.]WEK21120.1 MAG: NlpC/P60 family protein [Pedobacter sp.]